MRNIFQNSQKCYLIFSALFAREFVTKASEIAQSGHTGHRVECNTYGPRIAQILELNMSMY